MRLPPPSQAKPTFSPRTPRSPPVTETPPPAPPVEVEEEEVAEEQPSMEEEFHDAPQGSDPPATEPPVSESVHATSEYPDEDEEEEVTVEDEEETIEEEIITDGEETIEEIIEEEVTDGSSVRREETIIEEEGGEEGDMAAAAAGGAVAAAGEGGDASEISYADATSPPLAKKEAVMDNDLAAFMERRRQAADGGPIDDVSQTEKTEPMGNLPADGEEPEDAAPDEEEKEDEDDDKVLAAAAVGAAAGGAAGYYAGNREVDGGDDEDMEPIEEYDEEAGVVDEMTYDEPPVAVAPFNSQTYEVQDSPYEGEEEEENPYQQRGALPIDDYDQDEEQAPVEDEDKDREAPEEESNKPTWGLFYVVCVIAAILIALGVILGIVLSDDDDSPRSSPTVAPGTPTVTPVDPFGPIPMEEGISLAGPTGRGFGASIAASQGLVSVGAPTGSNNAIFNYNENASGDLELINEASGSRADSEFGYSMAMNGVNSIIVGAPEETAPGKPESTGFAYFYTFSPGSGVWELQGESFTGGAEIANINERFGESVAISATNLRAAVGAPGYNEGAGRVYMWELTGGTWTQMDGDDSLIGSTASELGSAVDISVDGSVVAAGSPGSSSFAIYEYQGGTWTQTFEESGSSSENLGTSVAVLSSSYVVVGSPGSRTNRGAITLFQKDGGTWTELGSIEGGSGERIGSKGLLTGTVGDGGIPEITFVTAQGDLQRVDYVDGEWKERFSEDTGLNSVSSLSIDTFSDTVKVWVGSSATGEIKEFVEDESSGPAPGQPTAAPTPFPTLDIPPGSGWVSISGPFTGPIDNTGYGESVAMDGRMMAAGLPRFSEGTGAVQTFQKVGAVWNEMSTVFDRDAEGYGQAVDLSSNSARSSLVVGAPNTRDDGEFSNLSFGAVYYLELDGDEWTPVGAPLRPEPNTFTSSGEFGASVAVSASARRIVVGAPSTSSNASILRNGRVYTYEFDGTNFVPLGLPIDGESAGDLLGSAVAMSEDGSRILIGAPGTDGASSGAVFYYSWSGSQWTTLLPVSGSTADENLGASVAIVASDGETIAMGAPNFNGGRGVVRVYRRPNPNQAFWDQLGPDIVGAPGESLGTTVSGSNSRIVVGTATGRFKVYDYRSSSDSWVLVSGTTNTGSAVVAIATDTEEDVVVGLANEDVEVYGLF